jgi:dihydroorotate dehydrogenase (fumarate)
MIDLKTKYAGLNLRNPIIIGSSGLTTNVTRMKEYEKSGAGAVVLKSLFEEQIEINAGQLLSSSDYPEAADYIDEYAKANLITNYIDLIKEAKAALSIPVIASINCYKIGSWIEFAKQIEEVGADALEVNFSFMETDVNQLHVAVEDICIDILKQIKAVVTLPVIIKIGKNYTNLPALVTALQANGAAAVVLFNRYYQPDIDINTLQITSANVFSSHSDLSETLRWTAIVSGKVPTACLSASTGVHDWEDLVKCILAGASTVQLCSTLYTHGSEVISQMLVCLEEWMSQSSFKTIEEIKGKLNFANIPNSSMYERSQFMKYFSNRD